MEKKALMEEFYFLNVKANHNSYFIDSPESIDKTLLKNAKSIGICGATSTPKWLMEEIYETISNEINKG